MTTPQQPDPNPTPEENTTATPGRLTRATQGAKRKAGKFFEGDEGSLFWLGKVIIEQIKIAAEAVNQQFQSAQQSYQKSIDRANDPHADQ